MTNFEFKESRRFSGDFDLVSIGSYECTPSEEAYLKALRLFLQRLSRDAKDESSDPALILLASELEILRSKIASELRNRATKFIANSTGDAERERDEVLRFDGIYRDRRSRIEALPFTVKPLYNDNKKQIDISILTRDVRVPLEKQSFKVEVDHSLTVVKSVLAEQRRRKFRLHFGRSDKERNGLRCDEKLDKYLYSLTGIAEVGLMNLDKSQTPFAGLALASFKDEFVSVEAGVVKNGYVLRLGLAGFVFSTIASAFYIISGFLNEYNIYLFRNFFLLAVGAAVGTWLSFSIRRVVLNFDDLAALEDDRLTPELKMAFMLALTTIVGLLFWTNAVSISIGNFNTDFHNNGFHALLIGALCGIPERAVTSAVSKRADDFAAAIGVKTPEGK